MISHGDSLLDRIDFFFLLILFLRHCIISWVDVFFITPSPLTLASKALRLPVCHHIPEYKFFFKL